MKGDKGDRFEFDGEIGLRTVRLVESALRVDEKDPAVFLRLGADSKSVFTPLARTWAHHAVLSPGRATSSTASTWRHTNKRSSTGTRWPRTWPRP